MLRRAMIPAGQGRGRIRPPSPQADLSVEAMLRQVSPGGERTKGDVVSRGDASSGDLSARCDDLVSRGQASSGEASKKVSEKIKGGNLNPLLTVSPDGLNAVNNGEWEEVELAVDSGASETVINEDMVSSAKIQEGEASRRGLEYEVANGVRIPTPRR